MRPSSLDSPYVEYRARWRTGGLRPGAFRGVLSGPGERFRTSVPLQAHADPRRLDVRASLRDPLGGIWVRDFEQNSALGVAVLVDASGSMGYVGRFDKFAQARAVAIAIARTAWRNGDAFGFFAANDAVLRPLALPVRLNRGAADWLERRMQAVAPAGRSARGMIEAAAHLPMRRSLVFIVSDFYWPDSELNDILHAVSRHVAVPVVLRDPAEDESMPRRGIAILQDLESGARRFVWLRPGLLHAQRARRARRDAALRRACAAAGCAPCFVHGRFEPRLLTRHFLEAAT